MTCRYVPGAHIAVNLQIFLNSLINYTCIWFNIHAVSMTPNLNNFYFIKMTSNFTLKSK